MSKRFVVAVLVIVLALIGVYSVTSKKDNKNGSSSNKNVPATEHLTGKSIGNDGKLVKDVDSTKVVTLTEYGDYQCPYCGQWYPVVKAVVEKYKDEPRFVFKFRNFTLPQHSNAVAAARAAEAAGKQNKYWEMHDLLYEQQKSWEQSTSAATIFQNYAAQLSLNLDKFKTDFASSDVNDLINADKNEGNRLGVESTPSFFLQDKKLDPNPTSVDEFSKKIDEALKS